MPGETWRCIPPMRDDIAGRGVGLSVSPHNGRQQSPPVNARSAFTLIEMLVALAIIALLAVLIFLGLSSARERSAIAQSSSNLRQLGLLAQQYAMDNNGFLPGRDFSPATAAALQWTKVLYELAYGKPFPGWVPSDTGESLKGTIFYSPMMKPAEGTPLRSYGINSYLVRNLVFNVEPDNRLRGAAVSRPSATLLFADVRKSSAASESNIQFRNNGRALLCFVDGHVESRLPSSSAKSRPDEVPTDRNDVFWSPK